MGAGALNRQCPCSWSLNSAVRREKCDAQARGRSQHGPGQRPNSSNNLRTLLSQSRKALEGKHFLFACFLRLLHLFLSLSSERPSWVTALSWWRGLQNSVKWWAMLCRATQDRRVIVKSSEQTWSPGGGNGHPLQESCLESPVDRGAWRATVRGVTKVRQDSVTNQQWQQSTSRGAWRTISLQRQQLPLF